MNNLSCVQCGSLIPPDAQFCGKCGGSASYSMHTPHLIQNQTLTIWGKISQIVAHTLQLKNGKKYKEIVLLVVGVIVLLVSLYYLFDRAKCYNVTQANGYSKRQVKYSFWFDYCLTRDDRDEIRKF